MASSCRLGNRYCSGNLCDIGDKWGSSQPGVRARIILLRNSYFPDPESDNGLHRMRFSFEPHDGTRANAECVRGGMAFNRPLLTALTSSTPTSGTPMISITGSESIVCTALRQAEYSDEFLIRLFEASGQSTSAVIALYKPITAAREVNFLENAVGDADLQEGKVTVTLHPLEVKTLAVTV